MPPPSVTALCPVSFFYFAEQNYPTKFHPMGDPSDIFLNFGPRKISIKISIILDSQPKSVSQRQRAEGAGVFSPHVPSGQEPAGHRVPPSVLFPACHRAEQERFLPCSLEETGPQALCVLSLSQCLALPAR